MEICECCEEEEATCECHLCGAPLCDDCMETHDCQDPFEVDE